MPFFPAPDDGCPGTAITPGACARSAHTIRPGACPDKVLGAEGATGATGATGPAGPQGIPGVDGDDGAPGTPGTPGAPGLDGDDGAPGTPGTPGNPGADGTNGVDGATIRNGSGAPSNGLGLNGDYYLNVTNDDLYFKAAGTYSVVATLKGATGATGAPGTPGADGTDGDVFHGTSANSFAISAVGDVVGIVTQTGLNFAVGQTVVVTADAAPTKYFVATITAYDSGTGAISLQNTKTNAEGETFSAWTITLSGAVGATGSPGADGADGADGTNGTDGSVWRDGTGVPSDALGVNGDYYLDDATGNVYLRAAGTYSVVASIKGADGADGADGGNAGKIFYLDSRNASDVGGMFTALELPSALAEEILTLNATGTGDNLLAEFITEPGVPNQTSLPPGTAFRHFHVYTGHATQVCRLKVELYSADASGGNQVLLRTGYSANFSGTAPQGLVWDFSDANGYSFSSSSRIIFKIYVARVSGGAPGCDGYVIFNGDEASYIQTTITAGSVGPAGSTGRSVLLCAGYTPSATGADVVEVVVPRGASDASVTWNVNRITLRVKTAGGAPVAVVEKSTAAGVFSATTVGTLTMPSGDYQVTNATALGTVASGDKLRFNVTTLGTALYWTIQVDIEE